MKEIGEPHISRRGAIKAMLGIGGAFAVSAIASDDLLQPSIVYAKSSEQQEEEPEIVCYFMLPAVKQELLGFDVSYVDWPQDIQILPNVPGLGDIEYFLNQVEPSDATAQSGPSCSTHQIVSQQSPDDGKEWFYILPCSVRYTRDMFVEENDGINQPFMRTKNGGLISLSTPIFEYLFSTLHQGAPSFVSSSEEKLLPQSEEEQHEPEASVSAPDAPPSGDSGQPQTIGSLPPKNSEDSLENIGDESLPYIITTLLGGIAGLAGLSELKKRTRFAIKQFKCLHGLNRSSDVELYYSTSDTTPLPDTPLTEEELREINLKKIMNNFWSGGTWEQRQHANNAFRLRQEEERAHSVLVDEDIEDLNTLTDMMSQYAFQKGKGIKIQGRIKKLLRGV